VSNYSLNSIYDLTIFKDNSDVNKAFVCNLLDEDELIVRRKKKKNEEIKRLERDAEEFKGIRPNINQDCIERVDDERYKKHIIIVSDNSFLLFERPPFETKDKDGTQLEIDPVELKFTMGKLMLWGTITSIEQLKHNMEFRDHVSIVWSKPVKNDDEFEFAEDDDKLDDEMNDSDEPLERVFETRLQIPNSEDFMMVVLDKMNKIKENTSELKKKKILSMEVTSDSIKGKNIKVLLNQIELFEKEYKEKKSKEITQELMELYKKVIEYYSALGDDQYKMYLHKNHELMNSF
jgi:superfamily II DNA helicase RecQ